MHQVTSQSGLVVMIVSQTESSVGFLGSGFVCNADGYILTCAHILNLTAKLAIVSPPPIDEFAPLTAGRVEVTFVEVVQIDPENDVALLKPKAEIRSHLSEKFLDPFDNVTVGQEVGCLGIPFGDRGLHTQKLSRTIICGKSVTASGSRRLHLDANLHEGNSGGPVLSTTTGQVIGLVSGRFSPVGTTGASISIGGMELGSDSTISFAVPIGYARDLLKREGLSV